MTQNMSRLRAFFLPDRRRRLKVPLSLRVFGIVLFLLPFYNYAGMAYRTDSPLFRPDIVLARIAWSQIVLALAAFPVAVAFLRGKKWGWWAFLIYSGGMLLHNSYILWRFHRIENLSALLQTVFFATCVVFIVRRDIAAPFFKVYPRGWRMQKRIPLALEVVIDGARYTTRDAGLRGIYVEWQGCPRNLGETVEILFPEGTRLRGGIVRMDPSGVGVAYRHLTWANRKSLKRMLEKVT